MTNPEIMHLIVAQMQADRRREATEPLDFPFTDATQALRRKLGAAMIRIGTWLGGHALESLPEPDVSPQKA